MCGWCKKNSQMSSEPITLNFGKRSLLFWRVLGVGVWGCGGCVGGGCNCVGGGEGGGGIFSLSG